MKILKNIILGLAFVSTFSYANMQIVEEQKISTFNTLIKMVDTDTDTICYIVRSADGPAISCRSFVPAKTNK